MKKVDILLTAHSIFRLDSTLINKDCNSVTLNCCGFLLESNIDWVTLFNYIGKSNKIWNVWISWIGSNFFHVPNSKATIYTMRNIFYFLNKQNHVSQLKASRELIPKRFLVVFGKCLPPLLIMEEELWNIKIFPFFSLTI